MAYVYPVFLFAMGAFFVHQNDMVSRGDTSTLNMQTPSNESDVKDETLKVTSNTNDVKRVSDHEDKNKLAAEESNDSADVLIPGHLKRIGEHGSPIILGEVEDLNYVPNGKDFYTHFIRKRRPLVMRGAAMEWSATKHWKNEDYLKEKYGHLVFDVEFTKQYENKHPIKKTMNLTEFLGIYKTKQVYLDCPFPQSDMTEDIMVPYCLQCEEIMSTVASIHLLYSSGNTSSSLHHDGTENLLSVISGTKVVLVADSVYTEFFYPNDYTTVPGLAPINPELVDLKAFPNILKVPFHKVRKMDCCEELNFVYAKTVIKTSHK